jgi:hypothetical protein
LVSGQESKHAASDAKRVVHEEKVTPGEAVHAELGAHCANRTAEYEQRVENNPIQSGLIVYVVDALGFGIGQFAHVCLARQSEVEFFEKK